MRMGDGGTDKPALVVSACLLGRRCRYDGRRPDWTLADDPERAAELERRYRIVAVCPEEEIGLGTPRPPIDLVREGDDVRLLRRTDRRDLGQRLTEWAESWLDRVGPVAGALLKARSPSCAPTDAAVRAAPGGAPVGRRPGLFAAALARRGVPLDDENTIRDPTRRKLG